MGRKKKIATSTVENVAEVTPKEEPKAIVNTKETYMFQIRALNNNVELYKYPTDKKIQGKLKKGEICNVVCKIIYTPMKMYKLDNGYYIIANQNIQII